jgi:pimeloyl-ACP methyl ester carboxylesterase
MQHYEQLEDRHIDTEYGSVHYKFHDGASDALVLVHGLAASARSWSRLIAYLPESYRVCAPDLLGHGDSEAPRISYSVDVQKEISRRIIKREDMRGAFMMGHSYGGWVAAAYAGSYPDLSGLILEDAGGLRSFFDEVRGTAKREDYKRELLRKSMELNAKDYVIKSILEDEFTDSELTREQLSRIRSPALILWGENDDVIQPRFADIFHGEITGSTLRIIKGGRHTPHYSNAAEVARLVVDFINGRLG